MYSRDAVRINHLTLTNKQTTVYQHTRTNNHLANYLDYSTAKIDKPSNSLAYL